MQTNRAVKQNKNVTWLVCVISPVKERSIGGKDLS